MPIDASIPLQVHGIQLDSPADVQAKRLTLANIGMSNEAARLKLDEEKRNVAKQKAILDIIASNNGDIEASLQGIAQIDPEVSLRLKDHVDVQKQRQTTQDLDARKVAQDNITAVSGTPVPEVDVTSAKASPMAYPGQVGTGPTLGGESQTVEGAHPVMSVPGALGQSGYSVRPPSMQDFIRKARGEEVFKKQLEVSGKLQEKAFEPDKQLSTFTNDKGERISVMQKPNGVTYQRNDGKQGAPPSAPQPPMSPERLSQELQLKNAGQGESVDLTPAGLDAAALAFTKTGQLPPMGMGKQGAVVRSKIINRAAELSPGLDIASNKADFKANQDSLVALQKNRDAVVAFENTASKNLDQFLSTAQKVVDLGSPWINQPIRAVAERGLGSADLIAFNAARRVAVNEIAKVTSNPALSGQLSDSARHEVESFIPADATFKQIVAVAKILKADMKNRHDSLDDQIREINDRIKGGSSSGSSSTRPPLSSFERK